MRFCPRALVALLGALPLQLTAQPPWPAELIAADRAASRRSGSEGIAAALTPLLADDAILLYPGLPLVQHHTVPAALRLLPASGSRVQWDAVSVEWSEDGRLAVMYGTTVTRVQPDAAARPGRFLSAWRLEGGRWTLHALALIGAEPADSSLATRVNAPRLAPISRANPFAAADLDFARRAQTGVGEAFEAFAAPDAVLVGATEPFARGPRGIRESLVRNGSASLAWSWRPVYVLGDGNLGVTIGEAEVGPYLTQYMSLWRRNADGTIRYIADGGAARPW